MSWLIIHLFRTAHRRCGRVKEKARLKWHVDIESMEEEEIAKTPSAFDRTIMPVDGPDPEVTLPVVWDGELANGMKVYGIEHNELPLVQFTVVLRGGHFLDPMEKAGAASMVAELMMQGTKTRTPQELEEAIEMLVAENASMPLAELCELIMSSVKQHGSQLDDQTLLLVCQLPMHPFQIRILYRQESGRPFLPGVRQLQTA